MLHGYKQSQLDTARHPSVPSNRTTGTQEIAMLSTQTSEIRPATTATMQSSSMEAGRQRQGRLWSNLKEVCDLLHIPAACSVTGSAGTGSSG